MFADLLDPERPGSVLVASVGLKPAKAPGRYVARLKLVDELPPRSEEDPGEDPVMPGCIADLGDLFVRAMQGGPSLTLTFRLRTPIRLRLATASEVILADVAAEVRQVVAVGVDKRPRLEWFLELGVGSNVLVLLQQYRHVVQVTGQVDGGAISEGEAEAEAPAGEALPAEAGEPLPEEGPVDERTRRRSAATRAKAARAAKAAEASA